MTAGESRMQPSLWSKLCPARTSRVHSQTASMPPLSIRHSAAARTTACATADQFCSSEACAPSHPTCLIASSVLRSASARSIRNPFSRLVPGALLDMQQRQKKKVCRAVESNAAAYSSSYVTAEACGNEARANPRLISALALRRRILISFARRPSRSPRLPCLVPNGCVAIAALTITARHGRSQVAGSSSRSRLAPLPKASPPAVTTQPQEPQAHRPSCGPARGIPCRCQWDENLPD
ncbi:hypothetical protein F5883DRAFT_560324 [Diaporthe sp. PMI_573]|nr:hypothetical protein F5883DRAFT_560324 [Diaporthaceae sp. PMI_573]